MKPKKLVTIALAALLLPAGVGLSYAAYKTLVPDSPEVVAKASGLTGTWRLTGNNAFSDHAAVLTLTEGPDNTVSGRTEYKVEDFELADTLTYKNQDQNTSGYRYANNLEISFEYMGESRQSVAPQTIFSKYQLTLAKVDDDHYEGKVAIEYQNLSWNKTTRHEDFVRLARLQ